MKYAIMPPERDAYMLGPSCDIMRTEQTYDEYKKYVLSPTSTMYKYQLVKFKRVRSGVCVKLRFFWRCQWYWLPRVSWRYEVYFHWLNFMFWCEPEYNDIFDGVVKDHYKENLLTDDAPSATKA